jgi:hypothetical protein
VDGQPEATGKRGWECEELNGSVANVDFGGKIREFSIGNLIVYRFPNPRKSTFATERVVLNIRRPPPGTFCSVISAGPENPGVFSWITVEEKER